jgi:hypothetical protein
MHSDNEQEDDNINRKDIETKVERFREQSQIYLNRLPLLKRQLDEINRLQQFDLYVQKLSKFVFLERKTTIINISSYI